MGLVLLQKYYPYSDRTTIVVDDVTQEYVDGADGGWGVSGNPDRADRCLLFWCKYIDYLSVSTYLSQQASTQDANGYIGVGDGVGLSNTDKSRFLVNYSNDGHHIFYMLPIERAASAPAGNEGTLYYNTTDTIVYIYESGSFRALVATDLPNIEGYAGISICEELFDLNKKVCLAKNTRELMYVLSDDNENKIRRNKKDIRELRNGDLLYRSLFKEGKQATARKHLKALEDVC